MSPIHPPAYARGLLGQEINVYFENEEFEALSDKKGDRSWHKFILEEALGVK